MIEQFPCGGALDDLTGVHYGNAVADFGHNTEIMGNQDQGKV
jgi:hypothetical protein